MTTNLPSKISDKYSLELPEVEVEAQIGRVLDQFPPPGQELAPGAEVTLIVGKRAATEQPEVEE